jgi:hypothetical protein
MTEAAETIGVISRMSTVDQLGAVAGSMYMNDRLRKINSTFFKWNGMESWNQSMRTAATGAGMRFLLAHSKKGGEARYLRELGVEASDIKEITSGPKKGQIDITDRKVRQALYKFVDSAVLRPNPAHRPTWGNDPYYMLAFHMKGFTFSFQKTILDRATHERRNGNYTPMFMLAGHVPIMMLSDLARGGMTGLTAGWTAWDHLQNSIQRAGLLGTSQFGADAIADLNRGTFPGVSFLGPTSQQVFTLGQAAAGDPDTSWWEALVRSMPLSPVVKTVT